MRIPTKKRHLKMLSRKIVQKLGHRHFMYHPDTGIRGFEGEGPLIVIGYRPSTDAWLPDAPSRVLLYSTLIENGVGDCHLTDCIKERALVKDGKKDFDSDWNIAVLRQEFEIVKPDGIIALGNDTERFLRNIGVAGTCPIWRVYHFSIIHNVYDRWTNSREAVSAFRSAFKTAVGAYRATRTA